MFNHHYQTEPHHNHGSPGTDKKEVMTSWSSCTPGKLEKRAKTKSCQPLLVPGRLSFLPFCHGIVLLPEVKSRLPVFPPQRARVVDSRPLATLCFYTTCLCIYIHIEIYQCTKPYINIHVHIPYPIYHVHVPYIYIYVSHIHIPYTYLV